jgi:hypothetical protein
LFRQLVCSCSGVAKSVVVLAFAVVVAKARGWSSSSTSTSRRLKGGAFRDQLRFQFVNDSS